MEIACARVARIILTSAPYLWRSRVCALARPIRVIMGVYMCAYHTHGRGGGQYIVERMYSARVFFELGINALKKKKLPTLLD